MKIILIDVMSLDGKLTKWKDSNIYAWSSPEDFVHFSKIRDANNLLVMGSGTFEAVRPQPEKERLRIILTNNPNKYISSCRTGQLEFTSEQPEQLIKRLEKLGYKQMLLVGGKGIATSFLQKHLVNELWLTIEPKIFGTGDTLVNAEKMDVALKLLHLKILNKQGTLLLKYKVL